MNRKAGKGFTLAEVLIALVVIGVIAALTLPSMITNIQTAQYRAAYKKLYSDLNQATNRIMTDNGGTIYEAFTGEDDAMNKFGNYLSIVKICPLEQQEGVCWHRSNAQDFHNVGYLFNKNRNVSGNDGGYEHYDSDWWYYYNTRAVLANGQLIAIGWVNEGKCTGSMGTAYGTIDKLCADIWMDVNGFKGPNTLGIDVFYVFIMQNGLRPAGKDGLPWPIDVDCIEPGDSGWNNWSNRGYACATKYLIQ